MLGFIGSSNLEPIVRTSLTGTLNLDPNSDYFWREARRGKVEGVGEAENQ
jgi:hypothetical protein